MSEQPEPTGAAPVAERAIERLVRLAGPREPIPPERLARLKEAAHAEWKTHTTARRRRRTFVWSVGVLATAAAALLAVRLTTGSRNGDLTQTARVGAVERVRGNATRQSDQEPTSMALRAGDALRPGTTVETAADGLLSIRLVTGVLVRLDRATRLRWESETSLVLNAGTVYVDSNAARPGRARAPGAADAPVIEVRTALGMARDIGTRFEVRVDPGDLRVRVRDGLVLVNDAPPVSAGNEMVLSRDGRSVRRSIAAFGPEWAWTTLLASPFTPEGHSLREFLDWVVGETGLTIRYTRSSDEERAEAITLHGSIEGLSPEEALVAMLQASGVEHAIMDGVLTIQAIPDAPSR